MLQKRYRLKSDYLYKQALNKATRHILHRGQSYVVYGVPARQATASQTVSSSTKVPQFGLVVSKKVAKRAVDRNRIKRRFREIIRQQIIPQIDRSRLSQYRAIVLIARDGIQQWSFQALQTDLRHGLLQHRAGQNAPIHQGGLPQ